MASNIGDFEIFPKYGQRGTNITIRRIHNSPEFNEESDSVSIRFIEERIGHIFVFKPHIVYSDSIQVIFNPNIEAPWENSTQDILQEGAIEYNVQVRAGQFGIRSFTWVSRKMWALEGTKNRFMLEDYQLQSECDSQNDQSTITTTRKHDEMMKSEYLYFFKSANLNLIFEKANIKEIIKSNPSEIIQIVEQLALLNLVGLLKFLKTEYGVDLNCVFSQGDNILDIGLKYKYDDIVSLANEFSLKPKQGSSHFLKRVFDYISKKKGPKFDTSINTNVRDVLNFFSDNFTHVLWENLSNVLFSSALSKDETEDLAKLLLYPQPTASTYDVLFAFQEALTQIQEFTDLYRGITSADNDFFKQTIKTLGLNEYLASEKMSQEIDDVLQSSGGTAVTIENLSLHLQIFKTLQNECPAMFQKSSLKSLGLTQENEARLDRLENALRAGIEITGVIGTALKKIEASYSFQRRIRVIQNLIKRKSWSEFSTKLTELYEIMKVEYQAQKQQVEKRKQTGDELIKLQIEKQENVLDNLEKLQKYYFQALIMFSERELDQGLQYFNGFVIIHQQMLQVCDNSVALVYVGSIKTGKSTIVNTIIGETISPSRKHPMTSIPVRYIHDPSAVDPNNPNMNNPVMLVPFAPQLNKVVRFYKKFSQETGEKKVENALPRIHLKQLHKKIMNGLVFKKIYQGSKDILDASIDIHDLFRLAVQSVFGDQLSKELPLDWSKGLDSFLTVSLKFPDFGHEDLVKLSIIDTPGVNEDGVKKLNLYKVIKDTVDVCHYVAFTLLPKNYQSNDIAKLKNLIIQIETHSTTPTLALVTNADSMDGKSQQEETKKNVSDFLRNDRDEPYPMESIYLISGKKKLVGKKMIEYIEKHNKKPSLESEVDKLAKNWASFAGFGDDKEEKREYYQNLKIDKVVDRSKKLIETSNMKPPMDLMIKTASEDGITLSCNKAIEKSVLSAKDLSGYLSQLVQINKAAKLEAQNLRSLSEEVSAAISFGAAGIKADITKNMIEFKKLMSEDTIKLVTYFSPELDQLFEGEWNFKTKEDAEKKINETLSTAQLKLNDLSNDLLLKKQDELRKYANDLKSTTDKKVFKHLQRIISEFKELENDSFAPVLPEIKISFDYDSLGFNSHLIKSQEQSTSLKDKFSSVLSGKMFKSVREVYDVDVDEVKKFIKERLMEFQKNMTNTTIQQVENELHKALDHLFLQALRRLHQLREALVQREKLAVDPAKIEGIFNDVKSAEIRLTNLKTDIKKEWNSFE